MNVCLKFKVIENVMRETINDVIHATDPTQVLVATPLKAQVSSYLAANRRRKYGVVGNVTLDSLQRSSALYRDIPDDIDKGYILDALFTTSASDMGSFVIVCSTVRMSQLDIGDIVHSDCTYKCTWNSYPVTLMGFSDKNRKFHPTIIAISSRETHSEFTYMLQTWKNVNPSLHFRYLMADASEAVFNAAVTIWPGIIRLMCYAHVYMVRAIRSVRTF